MVEEQGGDRVKMREDHVSDQEWRRLCVEQKSELIRALTAHAWGIACTIEAWDYMVRPFRGWPPDPQRQHKIIIANVADAVIEKFASLPAPADFAAQVDP